MATRFAETRTGGARALSLAGSGRRCLWSTVLEVVHHAGVAVFDPRSQLADCSLDPFESVVDALPPGCDQVDEEAKILHAPAAVGLGAALDGVEPADHLVHQAADLREVPAHGEDLFSQAVLDGVRDAFGESRGRLRGRLGEASEIGPCAFERGIERRRVGALLEPFSRTLDRGLAHDRRL